MGRTNKRSRLFFRKISFKDDGSGWSRPAGHADGVGSSSITEARRRFQPLVAYLHDRSWGQFQCMSEKYPQVLSSLILMDLFIYVYCCQFPRPQLQLQHTCCLNFQTAVQLDRLMQSEAWLRYVIRFVDVDRSKGTLEGVYVIIPATLAFEHLWEVVDSYFSRYLH
jgi:hypothetical protein